MLIFLENQLFVSLTFVYALLISVLLFSALIFINFFLGDFCFVLFFFKFYMKRIKKKVILGIGKTVNRSMVLKHSKERKKQFLTGIYIYISIARDEFT